MAENLIVDGITFSGVESVTYRNTDGERVTYVPDNGGGGGGGSVETCTVTFGSGKLSRTLYYSQLTDDGVVVQTASLTTSGVTLANVVVGTVITSASSFVSRYSGQGYYYAETGYITGLAVSISGDTTFEYSASGIPEKD